MENSLKVEELYIINICLKKFFVNLPMLMPDLCKKNFLESLKIEGDLVLNNLIEKAEEYVEQIHTINEDSIVVNINGTQTLRQKRQVYNDLKKLSEGGEELRKQGQLLHINQGLETQYAKSIGYIETLTSVISDRKYSAYRALKRKYELDTRAGKKVDAPSYPSAKWKFNFHSFVSNVSYRNAWIDIYGGHINESLFLSDSVYRSQILKVTNLSSTQSFKNFSSKYPMLEQWQKEEKFINEYLPSLSGAIKNNIVTSLLETAKESLTSSKVFFNILDTMQVPHFLSYLEGADMLHQAMMKTSAKYRAIFNLGMSAINIIGAYSENDKEQILKRTEQLVDRIIRDRFLVSLNYKIYIPKGQWYFKEVGSRLVKETAGTSGVTIQLGTRAGNASFKALMETKIIPDLQEGKIGGNRKDGFILHNEFIELKKVGTRYVFQED